MSLLSKYYDFNLIADLPLSHLDSLIEYVTDQEFEKMTIPLWLIHYMVAKLSKTEHIEYADYIKDIKNINPKKYREKKSPEIIIAEMMPIVEHYRNNNKTR